MESKQAPDVAEEGRAKTSDAHLAVVAYIQRSEESKERGRNERRSLLPQKLVGHAWGQWWSAADKATLIGALLELLWRAMIAIEHAHLGRAMDAISEKALHTHIHLQAFIDADQKEHRNWADMTEGEEDESREIVPEPAGGGMEDARTSADHVVVVQGEVGTGKKRDKKKPHSKAKCENRMIREEMDHALKEGRLHAVNEVRILQAAMEKLRVIARKKDLRCPRCERALKIVRAIPSAVSVWCRGPCKKRIAFGTLCGVCEPCIVCVCERCVLALPDVHEC